MNANIVRSAIHVSAIFAFYLATAMLIPALFDLYVDNEDWIVFAMSAALIGSLSALVAVATRTREPPVVSTRFTFLLVNMLWITFAVAATVPFAFSNLDIPLADAFFEAVSGATATGATAFSGLDNMPPGILLWRSMLQWIGGLGVIVLALFILPFLHVGGSNLFRIESSDRYDRPFARFSTFALSVIAIYASLTFLCAVLYAFNGMSGFDALNHALTTMATGGFSTHDASFAYFDSIALQWIAIAFMLMAAMPFTALIVLALRRRFEALRDNQIQVMLAYMAFLSLLLAFQLDYSGTMPIQESITKATFNVVSIITTTGYSSANYMDWTPFAVAVILFCTMLGGCAGSTTGGIKAYRWIILFGVVKRALEVFIYPNAIRTVRSGGATVRDQQQFVTLMYFATFFFLWTIGTMIVAFEGADLVTALSATLATIANVGPGLGDVVGPTGNYGSLSDVSKYTLSIAMLLGRLELFTMLVLLSPTFWRE